MQQAGTPPTLRGTAYTAYSRIGKTITAGQQFPATFCATTNGQTLTNFALGTSISGIESSGTGNITVWLKRVIQTSNGITVRMVEITVSGANPLSLPIGSDIRVASASSAAYPHS